MRRFGPKAAVFLLGAAAWGLAFEGAARAWVRWRGDPLDRVQPLLRLDPRLGWRQREGFRGELYGRAVALDELGLRSLPLSRAARARLRVLVLGPSSAFGWGVAQDEAYPARLEEELKSRLGGEVSVVNAGEIGYSSWQGLTFYRESGVRALRPQVVVVAYGANDADRFRFFSGEAGPDERVLGTGLGPWRVRNFLWRLRLLPWAERRAAAALGRLACAPGKAPGGVPTRRVEPRDFERLMKEFARTAAEDGSRLVFVTTAYRLPEAAARPLVPSDESYRLSSSLAAQGRCREARAAFEAARAAEPRRLEADIPEYNRRLVKAARALSAPVIDAARLLARSPALFADPVHPSVQGHAVIARELSRTLLDGRLLGP